jgi:hypothetical protein
VETLYWRETVDFFRAVLKFDFKVIPCSELKKGEE